jgi:hypothetical protein
VVWFRPAKRGEPLRILDEVPNGGPGPDSAPAVRGGIPPDKVEEVLRTALDVILTATGPRHGANSSIDVRSFDEAIRTFMPLGHYERSPNQAISVMDYKMYACRLVHRVLNQVAGRKIVVGGAYNSHLAVNARADALCEALLDLAADHQIQGFVPTGWQRRREGARVRIEAARAEQERKATARRREPEQAAEVTRRAEERRRAEAQQREARVRAEVEAAERRAREDAARSEAERRSVESQLREQLRVAEERLRAESARAEAARREAERADAERRAHEAALAAEREKRELAELAEAVRRASALEVTGERSVGTAETAPGIVSGPRVIVRGEDVPGWAQLLTDEGARRVFLHLATHGSITEHEVTGFLGSPRAYRRFTLEFDAHAQMVPFRVRIEPLADGKRYVKEGEN